MSDQLMKLFSFTENDLDYNRSGMLSPEQQARVSNNRKRLKKFVLLVGLFLLIIAVGWILIFSQFDNPVTGLVSMVVGGALFGLPGVGAVYLGVRPARRSTSATASLSFQSRPSWSLKMGRPTRFTAGRG